MLNNLSPIGCWAVALLNANMLLVFDTFALLQLLPYTAACPASYPYQCLTRVVLGDGHLFAALWEGKGGSQAARHCVSACYDVLQQCLQQDEPSAALQRAFKQLDETYLASDLPDVVSTTSAGQQQHQHTLLLTV